MKYMQNQNIFMIKNKNSEILGFDSPLKIYK